MNPINLAREQAEADRWTADTTANLGDPARAQAALRAVLHALRDSLPVSEAVIIANRLPALLRGIYTEGWHPHTPVPAAGRGEFLDRVAEGIAGAGLDSESATRAVFATLDRMLGTVPELSDFRSPEPVPPGKAAKDLKAAADRAALDGAPVPESPLPAKSLYSEPLQELDGWVGDLLDESGWTSREQALVAMIAVLQVLRDRLTVEQAFQLGSRLPSALRGFYFENWDPEKPPAQADFMLSVENKLAGAANLPPEEATGSVFRLLSEKLKEGMRELRNRRRLNPTRSRPTEKR
jgi:uncharacterized protein (DUF2267 family)